MKIRVNGKDCEIDGEMSLRQLLDHMKITRNSGVAVAVNSSVVVKSRLGEVMVHEGDDIEIIHAVQGG